MNNFVKERNNILKKIDEPDVMIKLESFCKKYNILIPSDTKVILAGLHKARLYVTSPIITEEMKNKSKLWLKEHNFDLEIK